MKVKPCRFLRKLEACCSPHVPDWVLFHFSSDQFLPKGWPRFCHETRSPLSLNCSLLLLSIGDGNTNF